MLIRPEGKGAHTVPGLRRHLTITGTPRRLSRHPVNTALRVGHLIPLLFAGLVVSTGAVEKDPVFDLDAILATPLDAKVLKLHPEKDGIITEEIQFHSEMDGGKSVDIFGIFSHPKDAKNLPAFIWNQGGLAQADPFWPEFGAKRGYAVLCIDFPLPNYRSTGGYPITNGFDLPDDPKKAPIYHGAVALLKAVSYLESRPEVDKNRIGMAGSSWGGFFTTLMVGVDPRLKVGAAMFGCGNMQMGNVWWDTAGWDAKRDEKFRERWRTTLDPAFRLKDRKTPIGWFTGTDDFAFWMPALMKTHETAAGPKHLTLFPNWNHGMTPAGDESVFTWLDVHLKGAKPFLEIEMEGMIKGHGGGLFRSWHFQGPRVAKSAEVMLSYGKEGNWTSRYWATIPAELAGGSFTAKIQPAQLPCYISGTVVDEDGFRYSTPLVQMEARSLRAIPDYDGCSMWGGFEEDHVFFLKAHAWMNPTTSTEAREGKQSALLAAGKNTLGHIHFTAGIEHRFTCLLKCDKPAAITVTLSGSFDGKEKSESKTVSLGAEWTKVSMGYTPPEALNTTLVPVITVPEGIKVLVDCVEFHPVPNDTK